MLAHQYSLSSNAESVPSSSRFGAFTNQNIMVMAEESVAEASKNLDQATLEALAAGEAMIRFEAEEAAKKEEEDKKKAEAEEKSKAEAAEAEAKAVAAAAEAVIVEEAEASYEHESDPRNAPQPVVVLETNEEEMTKVLETKANDEFEVFKKWKAHIDEIAKEQEVKIKEQYDEKVKEMEEFVNHKMYEKIFKEKELLEEKFKEQYRQAIQNLKSKFADEKKRVHEQSIEELLENENEHLELLSEVKEQYFKQLNQLKQETEVSLAKIEKQVARQHATRVEEQKELMAKLREHTNEQKKVNKEFQEGQSKVALSLAALSLLRRADSGLEYNNSLDEMARCAKGDPLLMELVNAIPRGGDRGGVATVSQLQVEFSKIVDQAFYDTLMGQEASLWAYAKSRVVGHTLVRKRGFMVGATREEVLARGEYYLGEGELEACIEELEKVDGPAKVTLANWVFEAKKRQETLLALEAIEAYVRVSLKSASV